MDIRTQLNENKQFINNFSYTIKKNNYNYMMNNLYKYIKIESDNYYINNYMIPEYNSILEDLLYVEETSHYRKIFNFEMPVLYIDDTRPHNYIDKLVFDSRRNILSFHGMNKIETNLINFANKCIHTAYTVFEKCMEDNVKSYIVKVYSGYKQGNEIQSDLNCHYFNVVFYNNKYYLVDLTYAQFFTQQKNVFNRLGVVGLDGCDVGAYMMQNEKTKAIAKKIIQDGYIQLNEEVFKTYLDAFTLSFRNGLYYENNGINSFEVTYTVDDYIKFLKGEDSQIKHEGLENLGMQKRPLKNHKIDFNTFVK